LEVSPYKVVLIHSTGVLYTGVYHVLAIRNNKRQVGLYIGVQVELNSVPK
jgi:hypothetical protein